jgi:hypothetical protein
MKKNIHKPSMTKGFQIKFQLEAQKTKSYVWPNIGGSSELSLTSIPGMQLPTAATVAVSIHAQLCNLLIRGRRGHAAEIDFLPRWRKRLKVLSGKGGK